MEPYELLMGSQRRMCRFYHSTMQVQFIVMVCKKLCEDYVMQVAVCSKVK